MADFALVRGPAGEVAAWLQRCGAAETRASGGLGLAVWGAALDSPDGRVVGAFAGVLSSDLAVAERLAQRGLAMDPRRHDRLAVTDAALQGPEALRHWRWQGALACLHLGQRAALLARDPLGVGWLGERAEGELRIYSNRLGLPGPWAPLPPGVALQVRADGAESRPIDLQGEARFYLRERPEVSDPLALAAGLERRLAAALQACLRGCGQVAGWAAAPTAPAMARWCRALLAAAEVAADPAAADRPGALWSPCGADQLLGEVPAPSLPEAARSARLPPPFEPVERCDPADAPERWWRARALDAALHAERLQAAAAGQTLVAPHLDAAVLAWLGAMARAQRHNLPGPVQDPPPESSPGAEVGCGSKS